MYMIEADGLTKHYGETTAAENITFSVSPGEVLGLLGPNGAGKTTTVKLLTTLLPIDAGHARIAGHDVATEPHMVRQCFGLAGQAAAVDEKLTARENLEMFARLYHLPRRNLNSRVDSLLKQFRLSEFADRPTETYSGGERRRLDLVASLVAEPPALFLDEPTTGLDPRSRNDIWDAIRGLASDGTAILLTTQYLEEADQLADQLVVIDQGKTVASGTPDQLKTELQSDVLVIKPSQGTDLNAATVIAVDVVAESRAVPAEQSVHVPLHNGAQQGIEVLKRMDESGVQVMDFEVRRPTLDDVFLSLTDRHNSEEDAVEPAEVST